MITLVCGDTATAAVTRAPHTLPGPPGYGRGRTLAQSDRPGEFSAM
jgi:hypothetical protein